MNTFSWRLLISILVFLPTACASVSRFQEELGSEDGSDDIVIVDSGSTTSSSDTGSESESQSVSQSESGSGSESASETSSEPACDGTMAEAFEGGALPTGWLVEDGDSDGYTWEWQGSGNDIGGEATGGYLMVDATTAVGAVLSERLVSLELSSQGCSNLSLSFDQSFPKGQDDQASVEISVNGAQWQPLEHYNAASSGPQAIDLTSVLSSDKSFRLGFLYEGSNGQYWKLDNVRIFVAVE